MSQTIDTTVACGNVESQNGDNANMGTVKIRNVSEINLSIPKEYVSEAAGKRKLPNWLSSPTQNRKDIKRTKAKDHSNDEDSSSAEVNNQARTITNNKVDCSNKLSGEITQQVEMKVSDLENLNEDITSTENKAGTSKCGADSNSISTSEEGISEELPKKPENGAQQSLVKIEQNTSNEDIKPSRNALGNVCDQQISCTSDEAGGHQNEQNNNIQVKKEIKEEPDVGSSTGNTTTSNSNRDVTIQEATSTLRDSCKYGIRCYRRNPMHRLEMAHPGDNDYRRPNYPPPPKGTPECRFGDRCYRRNPVHFQEYSHPPSTDFEKNWKERKMQLRKRKQKKNKSPSYEEEDEYDLDDPFIDDASDDEYIPSDDDDSD